jgi:futalosine hydrolase
LDHALIIVPTRLEADLLRGGTERVQKRLRDLRIEVCGFGPLAAAVTTFELLHAQRFSAVVLCGIAGAYESASSKIGEAVTFTEVGFEGIGVEIDGRIRSGQAMGFEPSSPDTLTNLVPFGDLSIAPRLMTVCVASGSNAKATERQQQHHPASVEDMEGFAVAWCCQRQKTPVSIVRGISNIAGDRDKSRWRIAEAMSAVGMALARYRI